MRFLRNEPLVLLRFDGKAPDQLSSRVHVQLAVDPPQVELDRLVREEERCADLAVRHPPRDVERDLELLRRELVSLPGSSAPELLTGRPQLRACPLGPWRRSNSLEGLEGEPELLARVDAPPRAS